jgi:hypothetical protein
MFADALADFSTTALGINRRVSLRGTRARISGTPRMSVQTFQSENLARLNPRRMVRTYRASDRLRTLNRA